MEAQRALLDELMGAERNLAPEQRTQQRQRHFSDRDVDKMYLVGCSPYELFRRTKSDIGPNPKVPDDACKAAWDRLSDQEKRRYGYEEDTRRFLERLVRQVDHRIEDNLVRSRPEDADALAVSARKVLELEERMTETLERLQALAKQGEVVMAFNLYKRVEELRAQRDSHFGVPDAQRRHLVCPVSGNLIARGDTDERLLSHFTGKQYNGWKLVRAKLKELNRKRFSRPASATTVEGSFHGRGAADGSNGHGSSGFAGRGIDRREYERRFPRDHAGASSNERSRDWSLPRDEGRRRGRGSSSSRHARKRGRSDEYDYSYDDDSRSRRRRDDGSGEDDPGGGRGHRDRDRHGDRHDDDVDDDDDDDRRRRRHKDKRSKKDSKKKHKKHKSSKKSSRKSSSSRHRGRSDSASDSDAEIERRLRERHSRSRH